ncbi:chemotaxis response regulator protein-glutamate methylesterase [Calothrix sp. FACHB-1219]|uniref:chemotaxis response regulator protein-glutamate methylesterase n=1 Tax=unclassified Calothrix TaxID=2619626 RepID=UPI001685ACDD|nr:MULTISPECIES: chemotaxis response regulator protein-glutamate methylesterase [unclassified Calothrix]MBD2206468.1 chemotaxis response regulator protein-glutamate methylesterase [Calothrix sp. FACHB-168]MBD2220345.1 chemotaxis response regulator protein-glutamate methylesterase [Calothrix sp. FACHB-1219]
MKIAIVNDLAIALTNLRRILQTVPEYKVIWTAQNGAEAVSKCQQNPPDLILMDLLMPVMDGVQATQQIMKHSPCAIVIVSTSTEKNVAQVYAAMGYGALDAVDTPILDGEDSADMTNKLLAKIAVIGKLIKSPTQGTRAKLVTRASHFEQKIQLSLPSLVAIGSSTGGPKALATILSQLPVNFAAAIAIVQHVNGHFSSSFAEWLNQQTALPVRLAVAGDRLQKGTVLLAGSNDHLHLKPDLTLDYTNHPRDYPYRPSVDVFFQSLAQNWKNKGTGILLTGMGRDGAAGLSELKCQGWHTIAQNQESCIVYGMPKAAVELNAAVEILSLEAIATTIRQKFI